jgi:hypothetical protein
MNKQQWKPAYTVANAAKHDLTHKLDCLADDGEVVEHAHRAAVQKNTLTNRVRLRVHIVPNLPCA